jgi:GT2 family glycosyltransferase
LNRRTYVLMLAYGRWHDTITCLHSVFAYADDDVRVVLVDNCSPDDTVEHVLAWAAGDPSTVGAIDGVAPVELPPIVHPIAAAHYSKDEAEAGGPSSNNTRLTVIGNAVNAGFGAGNNVGLRYILAQDDAEFIWLLNNYTVIAPGTLEAMESILRDSDSVGMCGSTVLHYNDPTRVQTLGGCHYHPTIGLTRRLGLNVSSDRLPPRAEIERSLSFIYGASMLVRRELFETCGLLTEETFIYHEELDLAERAKSHYSLAWAPDSIVYHKGGSTTDSPGGVAKRSAYSTYHLVRSRMWVTGEHFGWATPTVWLAQVLQAALFAVNRSGDVSRAAMRAVLGKPLES